MHNGLCCPWISDVQSSPCGSTRGDGLVAEPNDSQRGRAVIRALYTGSHRLSSTDAEVTTDIHDNLCDVRKGLCDGMCDIIHDGPFGDAIEGECWNIEAPVRGAWKLFPTGIGVGDTGCKCASGSDAPLFSIVEHRA
jgi:hypothetical protein